MQIDQRGGVKGSMGCIDNLLIDKALLYYYYYYYYYYYCNVQGGHLTPLNGRDFKLKN